MTRYDPFSYGSVRLDPGAPEEPRGQDAEEMLFAPGESVKQAPPADDSWSLMEEDVGSLLPGNGSPFADASDFGAEILGEASDAETAFSMPEPARRPEQVRANLARPCRRVVPSAPGDGTGTPPVTRGSPRPAARLRR